MIDVRMNKANVTPFIILTRQRCGSTYLRIWLNQHSKIHCYGEVFLKQYGALDGFKNFCSDSLSSRILFNFQHSVINKLLSLNIMPQKIEAYLENLFYSDQYPAPWLNIENTENNPQPREKKPVIGFKVMYSTLEMYPFLRNWLIKKKIKVIHLTRKNYLRTFVSGKRKLNTKIAHSNVSSLSGAQQPVHVNIHEFIKYKKKQKSLVDSYKKLFRNESGYIEISYEDFFGDMDKTKEKIFKNFSLSNEDMPGHSMKKIGAQELKDDILNWNEVVKELSGTENEVYLELDN